MSAVALGTRDPRGKDAGAGDAGEAALFCRKLRVDRQKGEARDVRGRLLWAAAPFVSLALS